MSVLLIPNPPTHTAQALSDSAKSRGLQIIRVSSHSDLSFLPEEFYYFGGPHLASKIQGARSLNLLEPADDWLTKLPHRFVKRNIFMLSALEAYSLEDQWFIKMPREKGLEPKVYFGWELPTLRDNEPLLISDLVTMTGEFRFWILDGKVHTSSRYRPTIDSDVPEKATEFVNELLEDQGDTLPSAVVVDIGWTEEYGWAVVEANMAWYSDHYAADPSRVLDVVLRSAKGGDQ